MYLVVILMMVVLGGVLIGMCKIGVLNKDVALLLMTLLLAVVIYSPCMLQDIKGICEVIKTDKEIDRILQDTDGKYFTQDSEYDKNYPTIKIVGEETKYITNHYKQKIWILDWCAFDFSEDVLYLNLDDVEKQ